MPIFTRRAEAQRWVAWKMRVNRVKERYSVVVDIIRGFHRSTEEDRDYPRREASASQEQWL